MNTSPFKTLPVATLFLLLSPALLAATPPGNPPPQTTRTQDAPDPDRMLQSQEPATTETLANLRERRAHALIGRDVIGANDGRFGRLDDLIVAWDSGHILYGVVSSDGASRAVPFSAFSPEQEKNGLRFRLAVDEATWTQAPRFEKQHLARLRAGNPLHQDIYRRFGQTPLAAQPDEHRLALVSETVGKPLLRGGQVIGAIEDVLVHLESQIASLLLNPPDEVGETEIGRKFVLPFYSITQTENNAFSTTLSPQQFTTVQAPATASQAISTQASTSPYRWSAYGAAATLLAAPPPAFQGRDLSASRPPIREIREALAADPHTRYVAVTVIAAADRVILQGTVRDEDDKRRIQNRVSQSAGGWNIDNQLRIASAAED